MTASPVPPVQKVAEAPEAPPPAAPAPPVAEPAPPPPPPAPPAHLRPEQHRRIAGYSAGGQKLLVERVAAAREILDSADDGHYSIELFITENTDPSRMERFLLRARDLVPLEQLYVVPMAGAGAYRLRVLFGDFATREEAAAADKRLPPRYQSAFRTSLRSFAELRGQI